MQFQKAPHANNDRLQCTNAQSNAPFLCSDGIVMDEIKKRRRRRVLTILRPREREGREGGGIVLRMRSRNEPRPLQPYPPPFCLLVLCWPFFFFFLLLFLFLSLSMDETGQQQPNFDDDPAAGFLAREQDELQGIMSDDAPLVRRESTERGTYDFHFLLEY